MTKRGSRGSRVVLSLSAAVALGLGVFWLRSGPPPRVGAADGVSFGARRAMSAVYASVSAKEEAGWQRLDLDKPTGWLGMFPEPVQSLETYERDRKLRVSPSRRVIVLRPLEPMSLQQKQMLPMLREYAQAFFQLPVRVAQPLNLHSLGVSRRGSGRHNRVGGAQYSAGDAVQKALENRLAPGELLHFGVTGADLYAGDLNFVFGLGSLEEPVGVYSLARNAPEFWNRKRKAGDEQKERRRACQTLSHEIGHIFGISHCVFYRCAMNGSNSLTESDAAPIEFCPVCQSKLRTSVGFSSDAGASKRRREMSEFCEKWKLDAEARWFRRPL